MDLDKLLDQDSVVDRFENHKVWALPSGNKLNARRKDPFGFIYLNFDKGVLPEELKGAFTSFAEAEKAVRAYMIKTGKELPKEK
jgi:hypothetical protein